MSAQALRPAAWLLPAGAAVIYVASLSAVLVEEWQEPRLLVVAFLGPSILAGLLIKRFSALVLPLGVVVVSLLWIPHVSGDPIVAMLGGLFAGVLVARVYEKREGQQNRSVFAPTDAHTHRWPTFGQLAKKVVTREGVDNVLDNVRFRIDTFPHGVYQPVASLPIRSANRGGGSESRWEAIFPVVCEQGVETAVDVGASEGYFSIRLGRACVPTIAMEGEPGTYRTAIFAVRRSGLDNVGVLAMELTPENVAALPAGDAVLCLSVWHHLVRRHGLAATTEIMETIWDRTGKVLFFDTGENEMSPEFHLPEMRPDARSWLAGYLAETCDGSRVEHLGMHAAFDPSGAPCERNLFAVIRV
jgi:hypothetical protein